MELRLSNIHEFIHIYNMHGENKDFLTNYCIISMMIPLANDINPSLMRTPRLPFSFSMMCSTTTNAKKYGIACLTIKLKLFQKLSFRYSRVRLRVYARVTRFMFSAAISKSLELKRRYIPL